MFGYIDMNMTMFHGLAMFIFWIIIFFLIFSFFNKEEKNENSALDILKKRFSKGEITKEQYEEMKKLLIKES